MERNGVVSSQIRSIGYNETDKILEIEFKNGSVYQYLRVPPNVHSSLMNSQSKGKYLHENVKGYFEFVRTGSTGMESAI